MFGMSLGEMLVLGVVAIVVVGPRNLPSMLRNAGQLIGRLRKMAADIRAESGIDEILEVEGIRSEIETFRKLASGQISPDEPLVVPDRYREYPSEGPDVYGAASEDLVPYSEVSAPAEVEAAPTLDEAPMADGAARVGDAVTNADGAVPASETATRAESVDVLLDDAWESPAVPEGATVNGVAAEDDAAHATPSAPSAPSEPTAPRAPNAGSSDPDLAAPTSATGVKTNPQ